MTTMTGLLLYLLMWIGNNTEYVPIQYNNLPEVYLIDYSTIGLTEDTKGAHVASPYLPGIRMIYLPDTFDITSVDDKGVLVHELIHDIQYLKGISINQNCKEQLSYSVQLKFLLNKEGSQKEIDRVKREVKIKSTLCLNYGNRQNRKPFRYVPSTD